MAEFGHFDYIFSAEERISDPVGILQAVGLVLLQLESEHEVGASLQFRLNTDFSVELVTYLLAYVQAKAYAIGVQLALVIDEPEQLKEVLLVFLTNTDTSVDDFELDEAVRIHQRQEGAPNRDGPSSLSVLQGV